MNKNSFRLIFSRRLNTLVAVSENVRCESKAAGGASRSGARRKAKTFQVNQPVTDGLRASVRAVALTIVGYLFLSGPAWAQVKPALATVSDTALPSGGRVVAGSVGTKLDGTTLTINQNTNQAIVNWNSFQVGSQAKVNIVQPDSRAVILNRVVGNEVTQIHGQINANGQVMLVNPNGIVVGKDGSVSASGFTASSYDIADANFMSGQYKFDRNGSTAGVRNDGKIQIQSGGYVALIGAEVINNGQIQAPLGQVMLVAGESVTLPSEVTQSIQLASSTDTSDVGTGSVKVPLSQRVRLNVTAAAINTAVTNTADGIILTESGQVLLQAAALADSVASVTHSGRIDTSGRHGGDVMILADHGQIKVNGNILADSVRQPYAETEKGGSVYIGRDPDTNVLAARTDVSQATIQSTQGFVETSGARLNTNQIQVKAKEWSLDPNDVEINATATALVSGASVVLASDINTALNAGTNVTISTGLVGASSSATGVAQATAGTGNTSSGSITVNENVSKTAGGSATLTLKANTDITFATNKTISSTAGALDVVLNTSLGAAGGSVVFNPGSGVITNGGNISMITDGYIGAGTSEVINAGLGTVAIQNKTAGTLINVGGADVLSGSPLTLGISNAEINRVTAANLKIGSATAGNLTVTSAISTAASTGNLYLLTNGSLAVDQALSSGSSLYLQTTGGSISSVAALAGTNISLDNTNGSIDLATGVITAGVGLKGASDASPAISVSAALNATGNVNIQGNVSSAANLGVQLNSTASVSSSKIAGVMNIASNQSILNDGTIKETGAAGNGSNINISAVAGSISGSGSIGDTTNKNATVTFTQAGNSTYHGVINALNLTKDGLGQFTLDSWIANVPGSTYVSNAYTVTGGGVLTLSTGASYPSLNPASVNVVNASTFVTTATSTGYWGGTAFNFTGGAGGGVMYLLGNPVAQGLSFSPTVYSTSGGATNAIIGGLNINSANVNLNLTAANSGAALADGSFAALAFLRNDQGGDGMHNAGIVTMSGGGNVLFDDRMIANTLNINSGSIQVGDGNAATAVSTPQLNVGTINIGSTAKLTFNRLESNTNASVIAGSGMLVQAGSGKLTLTGDSSGFAGATIVGAGKTLELGTGASLGSSGSTLDLVSGASSLILAESSGTTRVGSNVTGLGFVSQTGTGTSVLTGTNRYAGTTTISAGTLQVGDGGTTGSLGVGNVSLSNMANLVYLRSTATTIANQISGAGHVSANITGAASDLNVAQAMNLSGGTIHLVTDGNLFITQALTTTNASTAAVFLEAGRAAVAGVAAGGDVLMSGAGSATAPGRITIETGSIASSTGLGVVAGNSRYNSDESTTNYTVPLGASGTYVIYRDRPLISVKVNDVNKNEDGIAFSGGSVVPVITAGTLVNGDTFSAVTANMVYGGNAQGAVSPSNGTPYVISAMEANGLNALGYGVTYVSGALTINSTSQQTNQAAATGQSTAQSPMGASQQSFNSTGQSTATTSSLSPATSFAKIMQPVADFKVRPVIDSLSAQQVRNMIDTTMLVTIDGSGLFGLSAEQRNLAPCEPVLVAIVCPQNEELFEATN